MMDLDLAEGRIVLVLEGGYNLDSIANSMHACLEVLLEDKPLVGSSEAYPFESTWRVIQAPVVLVLCMFCRFARS
ncbi:histone deacetylase 5-like [Trifolium medium]|uniref:Histone deacetylase 5-like n=1 Tax=Trifolium medium TaxID=97028 RepID=A0A392QE51_9FABA|nr:histone deacetylase 5-like [Trifolium medium]